MSTLAPTYKWEESEKEPLPPLVHIVWYDAVAWSEWTDSEVACTTGPHKVETTSYLLQWNENYITVCSTVSKNPGSGRWEVTDGFSIPCVWVEDLTYLERDDG